MRDSESRHSTYTLSELNSLVSNVVSQYLREYYWVEAELSEVRVLHGNCYMELVQKDFVGDIPVAKASAKCWKSKWGLILNSFEKITGQPFRPGMKVLLKVKADFHPAYGFSWIVYDVEPSYTLGDMARKRQQIIQQLKDDGVFDLQKELKISLFADRIAVISSDNSAGYGDFCKQLMDNEQGFAFRVSLFPAVMQGENVESTIISALEKIYQHVNDFDVVVIIRGGGATSDLSGFDTLLLAENIVNFPLPVITGIGHDRDESVLDMVSNVSVKTPTAAAALLIDNLNAVSTYIQRMNTDIIHYAKQITVTERSRLEHHAGKLPMLVGALKIKNERMIERISFDLSTAVRRRLLSEKNNISKTSIMLGSHSRLKIANEFNRLQVLDSKFKALDPRQLLRRGYSMTIKDGHVVHDVSQLKEGDIVTTVFSNGNIKSKVYECNSEDIL